MYVFAKYINIIEEMEEKYKVLVNTFVMWKST